MEPDCPPKPERMSHSLCDRLHILRESALCRTSCSPPWETFRRLLASNLSNIRTTLLKSSPYIHPSERSVRTTDSEQTGKRAGGPFARTRQRNIILINRYLTDSIPRKMRCNKFRHLPEGGRPPTRTWAAGIMFPRGVASAWTAAVLFRPVLVRLEAPRVRWNTPPLTKTGNPLSFNRRQRRSRAGDGGRPAGHPSEQYDRYWNDLARTLGA